MEPVLPAFRNDEFLQLGEGFGFLPVGDTAWLDYGAC